jgi:hypothetical protein
MKTQSGSSGIPLLFLYPIRKIGVGGTRHAPAALSPGMAWYPLYRGWVERRADLEGEENKFSSRIPSSYRPASSESLYRLSSPGPPLYHMQVQYFFFWLSTK